MPGATEVLAEDMEEKVTFISSPQRARRSPKLLALKRGGQEKTRGKGPWNGPNQECTNPSLVYFSLLDPRAPPGGGGNAISFIDASTQPGVHQPNRAVGE